jgi:creatinine amidohydrolase
MKKLWTILALTAVTAAAASAQQPAAGGAAAGRAAAPAGGAAGGGGRAAQPQPPANLQSRGGGTCARNTAPEGQPPQWEIVQKWNCINEPNPLPPTTAVMIEDMTWMDVRDALAAGKRTAIIATGGMEPNGPFLTTGKHNFVLRTNCEAIARRLGNALCAPIVKFVPEGSIETKSGHMASPGTISMREETYRALLTDIAESLAQGGFENIIFIGDSGGNPAGMNAVSEALNAKYPGAKPMFAHVPEHYSSYSPAGNFMEQQCMIVEGTSSQLHDDPIISLNMYANDPNSISYDRRLRAGLGQINGVDISDPVKAARLAQTIVDFRVDYTIEGIKKAIAAGGTVPVAGRAGGGGGGGAAGAAPAAGANAAAGRAAGGAAPAAGGARAGGAAPAAAPAQPARPACGR